MGPTIETRSRLIHGYRRMYRIGGSGSPVLLIHGIGDSSATWSEVLPLLAEHHTVIAPDLLGHGGSDKPRADYSVAAFANGMRDLLVSLGIERATIVGHSLGGGVAGQFAYQYPEMVERLVLVAGGGVGRRVSPFLRFASLPAAELAYAALQLPTARLWVGLGLGILRRLDTDLGVDAPDLIRVVGALPDQASRRAFTRTLRSVVDWRGQVITMLDRAYLTFDIPTLLIWGTRDVIVPSKHAVTAHAAMIGSRLEMFDGAGHFPFRSDPHRFAKLVMEHITTTDPAKYRPERWRSRLLAGRWGDFVAEVPEAAEEIAESIELGAT